MLQVNELIILLLVLPPFSCYYVFPASSLFTRLFVTIKTFLCYPVFYASRQVNTLQVNELIVLLPPPSVPMLLCLSYKQLVNSSTRPPCLLTLLPCLSYKQLVRLSARYYKNVPLLPCLPYKQLVNSSTRQPCLPVYSRQPYLYIVYPSVPFPSPTYLKEDGRAPSTIGSEAYI